MTPDLEDILGSGALQQTVVHQLLKAPVRHDMELQQW